MALRRPLVRVGGVTKELPAGDTLPSNAFFTGTASTPLLGVLGTNTITVNVTPVVPGDVLAVGEAIDAYAPSQDLPAGLIIGQARVVTQNQARITLIAVLSIGITSINWTIKANR